jgi:integrase
MSIRTRTDARGRTSHQVRLPGERARTFRHHRNAERYETKRKEARASGEPGAAAPITLAAALEGAIGRWLAAKSPAPSSVTAAKSRAGFWTTAGLGETRLDRLDLVTCEDAIVSYAADAPAAAKVSLEWFKRGLRDAQRRRQVFDPALLSIPPIRVEGREGIALDLDELQALGSWFPPHINRFPGIVGSIGFRIGEALGLTEDRIDLDAGQVFIPASMCKEGRAKTIALADFERALIAEQLLARSPGSAYLFPNPNGHRWDVSHFHRKVWRPAREAAARTLREKRNLPEWEPTRFDLLVPHDLRHTGISAMAAGGMRPEVIAKRVGHSDGGKLILSRYRHLFPDEMGSQLAAYGAWRSARLATAVGS